MDVVCTNKGQHREIKLREFRNGRLVGYGDHGEGINVWHKFGHWAPTWSEEPIVETQVFACRRCGRSTRVSAERLTEILDRLTASQIWLLDVSYLPF